MGIFFLLSSKLGSTFSLLQYSQVVSSIQDAYNDNCEVCGSDSFYEETKLLRVNILEMRKICLI